MGDCLFVFRVFRTFFCVRGEIGIKVSGRGEIPSPVRIFSEVTSLGRELLDAIHRHGYDVPTEIQSQALPVILEGRDVIGIAKTGSGKTVLEENGSKMQNQNREGDGERERRRRDREREREETNGDADKNGNVAHA